MMKTVIGVMLVVGASTALAQPKEKKEMAPVPPPMAKPTPAKELDATKPWQKTWACTATNEAGEKVLGKLAIKKELDGFWVAMTFTTQKTKTRPGFTGNAVFGIDPVSKAWVMTGYDNMGGWINMKGKEATATSMVWEGEAANGPSGRKVPSKFTLTMGDKKTLKFIGEFGGKKGFEHDCK